MFDKKETITLTVEGMSCDHCRQRVENGLKALDGVKTVRVSLDKKQAEITYIPARTKPETLKEAIRDMGYQAE